MHDVDAWLFALVTVLVFVSLARRVKRSGARSSPCSPPNRWACTWLLPARHPGVARVQGRVALAAGGGIRLVGPEALPAGGMHRSACVARGLRVARQHQRHGLQRQRDSARVKVDVRAERSALVRKCEAPSREVAKASRVAEDLHRPVPGCARYRSGGIDEPTCKRTAELD